uniref:Homeobox protein unc-62 n=1 Tax=Plectus sambesii TaxID=2011161 RepID=A0A914ULH4_9BILA
MRCFNTVEQTTAETAPLAGSDRLASLIMLKRLEAEGRPVRTGDDEVDRLVRDSILVLRMNLVELAKVADLCDDFRTRYVQCIKRKMNQETLLGFGNDSDDESMNGDGRCSPGTSNRARGAVAMLTTAQGTVSVPLEIYANSDVSRMDQEATNDAMNVNYPTNGHFSFDDDAFNFEHRGPGRKSSLPKKAVDVLKGWLFQHVTHPYPTELEKAQLSQDTSLSLSQVNNWFINARRRILQPMLDGPCNEWSQSVTVPKNKKQRLSTASSPEIQCSPLSADASVAVSAADTTRDQGAGGSSPESRSSSVTATS